MSKLNLILVSLLFLITKVSYSQNSTGYTIANTKMGEVKIPGDWKELNTIDDSGQIYFINTDQIIIAIAQNPKKSYPFFKSDKSDFENVNLFYIWDSDYMNQNNYKTTKIKENSKSEYIIWKYNDGKLDNVFLFGSTGKNFLNLLVYTDYWDEDQKVRFLESIYHLNKIN